MKCKIMSLAVLMMLMPLGAMPANAMSCADDRTFEQKIDDADAVFEGYQIGTGLVKQDVSKMKSPLVKDFSERQRFNFNKPYYYFVTSTFKADKVWKGVTAGQEVTTVFFWPFPAQVKDKLKNEPFKKQYEGNKIFILKKNKDAYKDSEIKIDTDYHEVGCEKYFDITAENTKILQKKFPQAAAQ